MKIIFYLFFISSSVCCQSELSGLDDTEMRIVKAIEALHGTVGYEDEPRSKKVIEVDFLKTFCSVKDQDLVILKDLTDLKSLFINKKNITGKGLENLNAIGKLFQLELSGSGVDDEAMKWVGKNKNIKNLGLAHTKITDKGLLHLSQLKSMEFLDLRGTSITDSGLIHLKDLKKLELLLLPKMEESGSGLRTLKKALPNLKIQ